MTASLAYGVRRQGVALVAVLWVVAALSILVVGMSYSVRGETRKASLSKQSVVAGALGTAAINLVLQEMLSSPAPVARLSYKDVEYQDRSIRIEISPLNGLIDINNASESLLTKLISIQGGINYEQAQNIARRTIEIRSKKDPSGQNRGFESIEDWLKVPGIDYTLYAKLKPSTSVDLFGTGSGRINVLAAPREVLRVLTGGNAELAARIASDRDAGRAGLDTSMLDSSDVESAPTSRYRLTARVPVSADTQLWTIQTIDMTANKRDGLPWRLFHAERRFELARPEHSS